MTWLFAQFWLLALISFVLGAFVTWLVARVALPHISDLDIDGGR